MLTHILTALFFFLGLSFALSPADGFDVQIVRLIVPSIFCGWLLCGAYQKKIFLPQGFVAFFFVGVFLWSALSLFYSDVPLWTMRKLLFFFSLAPLFFVLVDHFIHKRGSVDRIIAGALYGGAVVAGIALAQFVAQFIVGRDVVAGVWAWLTPFFLGGTFSESVATYNSWYVHVSGIDVFRAIAFFPDPHILSFYMGILMPFALLLYLHNKRAVWLVVTILLLIANILSFSRGGQVALLVFFITFLFFVFPRITTRTKHFFLVGVICVGLPILLYSGAVFERFLSSFDPSDTSATSRIVLWEEAYDTLTQYPLLGTGLGAYAHISDPRATYRTPIYAHNTYLDIAVEVGVVGFALWMGLIVSTVVMLWRARMHIYAQAGILSIVTIAIHGVFDTPLFSVHIFTLLTFLFSLGAYYEHHNTQHTASHHTS